MKSTLDLTHYALYIHYPWCIKKCPYCDFNSHTQDKTLETSYINALIKDLKNDLELVKGRTLSSIFFGGGTPSLMSVQSIEKILNAVSKYGQLADNIEITLEANPGTLEAGRFQGYRQAGVNRLSIGVQSFDNQQLKNLGRIHNKQQAIKAIESAISAGFTQVNLDLMYALPHQTQQQALADLTQACAFGTTHLSWYQLTIEPNTLFYNKPPVLPEHDQLWEIQQAGQNYLQTKGFKQYEISAYSQIGAQCQHNLNYWSFGDYLGIGAGAQAKISQQNQIIRRWKKKNPRDFIQGPAIAGENSLNQSDLILEFMMNALRLTQGIEKKRFIETTGLPLKIINKEINQAIKKGLLEQNDLILKATPLGQNFLNDLLQYFNIKNPNGH